MKERPALSYKSALGEMLENIAVESVSFIVVSERAAAILLCKSAIVAANGANFKSTSRGHGRLRFNSGIWSLRDFLPSLKNLT